MTDEFVRLLRERLQGEVLAGEPLSRHTSLKVGGKADLFVTPADRPDLAELCRLLTGAGVPYLTIGGGYNLLVRDGGFRGVVVSLSRLASITEFSGGRVEAEGGVTNRELVAFCRDRGLAGLEFLATIPGTVGGALAMNAGAYGGATLELVESLTTLRDGVVTDTRREELAFGYRYVTLAPGEVILAAVFRLTAGEPAEVAARVREFQERRAESQNVGHPNAGSFFKNPPGEQAWRLIDRAGLRGERVGGAMVSDVHANFLVNTGGAAARDFLELAALVKARVKEATGCELEEEVRIIGEDEGE